MKEGCPLSPTLFLPYYNVLLWETLSRHPKAHLYVFVDDIAVRAADKTALRGRAANEQTPYIH